MPIYEAQGPPGQCSAHDSNQHRCAHTKDLQQGNQQQSKNSQHWLRIAQVSKSDNRGGIGNNNPGIAEPDEGNEESYATGNSRMQFMWNCTDKQLAYTAYSQE